MPSIENQTQAIKALKNLLDSERNQRMQKYISKLSPTAIINYSLWNP